MEWFLGFLIIVGFAVDIVLYIVDRGGFIRVSTSLENLAVDVKNLGDKVGKLAGRVEIIEAEQKTLVEADPKNLRAMVESWNIEGVFTQLDELAAKESITRQDVNLLLRAGDEHPVTAVLEPARNKGGRPRKGSV